MGKTETDDATHDLRILSFKKIFQPAQHNKLRVNELANKLLQCNIKTNFRKFICAAVTKDKFTPPCPLLCKNNFCEAEILFVVAVSSVFS